MNLPPEQRACKTPDLDEAAIRADERRRMDNAITWDTTCFGCADRMDGLIAERNEGAREAARWIEAEIRGLHSVVGDPILLEAAGIARRHAVGAPGLPADGSAAVARGVRESPKPSQAAQRRHGRVKMRPSSQQRGNMRDVTTTDQPTWLTSSFCSGGSCVEVAHHGDTVLVRDGKDPDQPALTLDQDRWRAFQDEISRGDFHA